MWHDTNREKPQPNEIVLTWSQAGYIVSVYNHTRKLWLRADDLHIIDVPVDFWMSIPKPPWR